MLLGGLLFQLRHPVGLAGSPERIHLGPAGGVNGLWLGISKQWILLETS